MNLGDERLVRRLGVLSLAALLALLAVSCRRAAPPVAVSEPSHIRIEPARAKDDPLRDKVPSGAATEREVGMAFYPGATVQSSSLVRDGRGVTAVVKLATREGYAPVTQFYLNKYGRLGKIVNLDGKEGRSLAINWGAPGATFTIDIKQDLAGKQTLIHLVRLTGSKDPKPHKEP